MLPWLVLCKLVLFGSLCSPHAGWSSHVIGSLLHLLASARQRLWACLFPWISLWAFPAGCKGLVGFPGEQLGLASAGIRAGRRQAPGSTSPPSLATGAPLHELDQARQEELPTKRKQKVKMLHAVV